eukprot:4424218-Lingulodinium_polyedra.AAC.1
MRSSPRGIGRCQVRLPGRLPRLPERRMLPPPRRRQPVDGPFHAWEESSRVSEEWPGPSFSEAVARLDSGGPCGSHS